MKNSWPFWICAAAVIGNMALAHFGFSALPGFFPIVVYWNNQESCDCEEDEDETEDKETEEAPGLPSMGAESGRLGG